MYYYGECFGFMGCVLEVCFSGRKVTKKAKAGERFLQEIREMKKTPISLYAKRLYLWFIPLGDEFPFLLPKKLLGL